MADSVCAACGGTGWKIVERAGLSNVSGVWCHEAGGARMFNVISIRQAYAGHARQAGMLAAARNRERPSEVTSLTAWITAAHAAALDGGFQALRIAVGADR